MHIREHKDGYQAQVKHKQYRASKVFPNKGMAQTWATEQLKEFKRIAFAGHDDRHPVAALFERYAENVSPTKKGSRWEILRLRSLSENKLFKSKKISQVTPEILAQYRDERLKEVSAGTVLRELSLLSGVFDVALKEWKMIAANPVKSIRKPKAPPHRDKVISDKEVKDFLAHIDYDMNKQATSTKHRMGVAFLFAIQTGMRCSEFCNLRGSDINGKVATLKVTKNGKARQVPLSTEARRLLSLLPDQDKLFDIKPANMDALFRKYRDSGKFEFRLHDCRHTAVTWMSKKVAVMDLAKIIGHSDPRILLNVYYNPKAADLVDQLD
jgi:integrase